MVHFRSERTLSAPREPAIWAETILLATEPVGCAARHNDTRPQLSEPYGPPQFGAYTPVATNRPKLEYGQSPGAMTRPCLTGFQWM